jgi:plastocyanin
MLIGLSQSALADGSVMGVVALDTPRPPAVSPGYKPQTVKPIQHEEATPAIVWVEQSGTLYPKSRVKDVQRIVQHGYQFRPAVCVLQTGASVEFPNMDDEFHNVFSYSKPRRFDLGRFRKDETSPRITFDRPGLVKVYCEIHQHMRCRILVLDTPWFALSDRQGQFKITGLPAGEYQIKAMLPSEKVVTSTLTIRDGQTASVRLSR